MVSTERRSFPRIKDEGLSLRLNVGSFDTVTHTLDISASGLYCKVDKEIPLMSRVRIALMVPDPLAKEEKRVKSLEVDGVVVREHPVIIDGSIKHYDIAVFFDSLSSKDRDVIQNYISTNKKGE